jgi:NAD(P)-dependent dehydrogenase (short-subunit alcohol dehydrogenase family)
MSTPQEVFAGKSVVITGAGSGIGAALARQAAELGMDVVLADISEERLAAIAGEIAGHGRVVSVPTDVSDAAAVERLAARAYDELGSVRLFFNNAGIESTGPVWELTPERWDLMMKVNVYGVFNGVRSFIPRMLAEGGPASIVNTSSIGGLTVGAFQAAYIASKFAVQALTECLYMELQAQQSQIVVSVVNPGPVSTRIFEDAVAFEGPAGGPGDGARTTMRALLREEGITPAQAAAVILDGAAEGLFWIFPHPEMADEMVKRRADMILSRQPPQARR